MIISDQFNMIFSIGDIEDFITPDNLLSFELFEAAGNARPIIKMSFILIDKDVINYLNPGNILSIRFGIDQPSSNIFLFELQGDNTAIDFTLGNKVQITAALYLPKFTSNVKSKGYGECTSVDVLKQLSANGSMKFKTNVGRTADKQMWFQQGKTDWDFAQEVWLHAYQNEDTFFNLSFDEDSMYFYDIKQAVLSGPTWQFSASQGGADNSNIVNFATYFTTNQYGTVGNLLGKNIKNNTFNLTTGEFSSNGYKLKNLTTRDSNKLNLNVDGCQDYSYSYISSNVHENYVKAYNQNMRNNILFSTYTCYISIAAQFRKFKLMDTATITPVIIDDRISGIWFITGICYQYQAGD